MDLTYKVEEDLNVQVKLKLKESQSCTQVKKQDEYCKQEHVNKQISKHAQYTVAAY